MVPSQKKIDELEQRMKALGLQHKDIEEKFIKSSGKGGQKVNKSSSAVYLKHTLTQISVKEGKSRSQKLNRFLALRRLVDKIEAKQQGISEKEQLKIEKKRKQKQRRKRRHKKKQSTGE